MPIPKNLKIIASILIFLIFLILFSFFLVFKSSFTPNKEVFSTKFYTTKNVEIKLSVNELGFFFEPKTYRLEFVREGDTCLTHAEIPRNVGEVFTANYKEKPDLTKMFDIQKDRVVLFQNLLSESLSTDEIKKSNYSYPHITNPESFYTRTCR